MKNILIIDESEVFRDFLSTKLKGYGFEVSIATNGLEGSIKMRQSIPDLIIMDYFLSRASSTEILEIKSKDRNLSPVPVMVFSSKVDRDTLLALGKYGVKKIFNKPVKIDALAQALNDLLGVGIKLDNTPCIIDANYNEGVLFIEVARGLNADKIELLRFRILELIKLYNISQTRVLLMMTGLEVSASDSIKLASLFATIIDFGNVVLKNLKVLTTSEYIKKFLSENKNFAAIEVVNNIEFALDHLLGRAAGNFIDEEGMHVQEEFLRTKDANEQGLEGFHLKFQEEVNQATNSAFNLSEIGANIKLAIVDDDMVLQQIIANALRQNQVEPDIFSDGKEFLNSSSLRNYDLVFLDLMMPNIDGFQVLNSLMSQGISIPIIVLSAISSRDAVVKALKLGVKSYMVKPIQPEMIIKKAIEILRMSF